MNMMTTITHRAALMAAAPIRVPVDLQRKDAPDFAEALKLHVKGVEDTLRDFKGTEDELKAKVAELTAEVTEISQKMARRGGGGGSDSLSMTAGDTWGHTLAHSDELKAVADANRAGLRAVVAVKAITSATGSGDALVTPDRQPDVVALPTRRFTVRQLLSPGRTNSNSVEYPRQTLRQNAATVVAEGNLKPESAYTFELVSTPVRTIAHWTQASRQVLSDAPLLQSTVDTELRYGLAIAEETEMLLGDGTGQHLFGLIPQATAFDETLRQAGDTEIDIIGRAIGQSELALLPATGIMLNTVDWNAMRLIKDGQGNYLMGNPQQNVEPRLWGLPVAVTPAMPVGRFLVGSFLLAAQIFDREEASVELSTEDRDNFIRNLVTLLAEQRMALAVKRREAIIYGRLKLA
ncbi:phage major capsid protein [Sphingomonas hankookensis]|uniref:phage major capsid protein n=1 Tax=Sphingomonas hankookensis TaxID=563996 RepID=UPI003D3029C5